MSYLPPRNQHQPEFEPGLNPAESLQLLEVWLLEVCDWLSRLIRELSAVRMVIGKRFLAESEALIAEHREWFQSTLPRLLELELDITGLGRQLDEFEALCEAYQALVAELKTRF